jgi:FlaA1/EpsC-like NDP-sugar epimerase
MGFKVSRATLVYLHDLVMTGAAFVVALALRVGHEIFTTYEPALVLGPPLAVMIGAVIYRKSGLYRGIWRYASVPDVLQLTKAVTLVSVSFVVLMFLLTRLDPIPRSLPIILWFVLMILLGTPRFAYRLLKDRRLQLGEDIARTEQRIPVLLIGAGDGADLLIRSLAHDQHAAYRVVGVLDEKGRRVGREIRGIPVLGDTQQLGAVVADLSERGIQPQRLILTRPQNEIAGSWLRHLLEEADNLGLTLSRLPNITEFKDALGEGKIELRPIAIEDLLGRPQTILDRRAIEGLVAGRRVLITGAGGTIGGELTRQIAALGPSELVLVDAGEFNLYTIDAELRERFPDCRWRSVLADIRDRDRIVRLFQEARPELVFHAAALKHVPMVELNPIEGVLTNGLGTRNVADAARTAGTRAMVLISTDKAVRPTSVMGAAKRIGEAYCQSLDVLALRDAPGAASTPTRFMTVRFGNVLGSSGSVVPLFRRQLEQGGPITVTHPDMRRYFMTVREAVELVLQASAHGINNPGERGKIFVLDMGEPVRIVDLARQMIRLAGLRVDTDIKIVFTGLRPGEKLFEEILSAAEAPTRTEADGVFLASPRVIDYALLNRALHELETATRADDLPRVMTILGNLVPDFSRPTQENSAALGPS